MTAILMLGGIILLLVLALEPARRGRQQWAPRPGIDVSRDRDTQRLRQELSTRIPASASIRARTRSASQRLSVKTHRRTPLGRHSAA